MNFSPTSETEMDALSRALVQHGRRVARSAIEAHFAAGRSIYAVHQGWLVEITPIRRDLPNDSVIHPD